MMKPASTARRLLIEEGPTASVEPATVVAIEPQDARRCIVQLGDPVREAPSPVPARIARIAGYGATPGDRVLVATDASGAYYVTAVLEAQLGLAVAASDGAVAEVVGNAIELRDASGRVLIRYSDGVTQVHSPARDLVLEAPAGRVVLRAAEDVVLEAARDVTQRAGRSVDLTAGVRAADAGQAPVALRLDPDRTSLNTPRLEVKSRVAEVVLDAADLCARVVTTTAERIKHGAARYEVVTDRLVETAREAVRDVRGLLETTAGRTRTVVRESSLLRAERITMVSEKETSIDGERILLG